MIKALENPVYLTAYIISNIVAIFILWAAFKRPKLARLLLALVFGWACITNYTLAHTQPHKYLEYASMAAPLYRNFINGWFSHHITAMITVISIGQALICAGMLLKKAWVEMACIGAVVFFFSIAPLGIGAAFPFSITVSIAAIIILMKDDMDYLWHRKPLKKLRYGYR